MIDSETTTVERQARMSQESYHQLAVGGLLAVQEQNMKLARYPTWVLLKGGREAA